MRVVLASERPQIQHLLMDMIEEEPGAIVVGQAENAIKTLVLAENLRPDVAIIDSNLPYSVGLDKLALSRMSGLDIGQMICQKLPGTRVVILNNLDAQVLPEVSLSRDNQAFFSRERLRGTTSFKLQELCREAAPSEAPVFASVEVESWSASQQKDGSGAIGSGAISIAGGLYLIGTLWLAPYGVLLALGGVFMLAFGLFKKMTTRLWRKSR
ncbi:MAG: response regulator transcription factor [Chloroflexi bacterium]|nr:response regulator transcription factor [Chloroflexota bacterium]